MALTPSNMLPLGTQAPNFALVDTMGNEIGLASFAENDLLLVAFICNHCPFVKHLAGELAKMAVDFQKNNVGVVAINSNDIDTYPEDDMKHMQAEVKSRGYTFPYLLDESQQVARSYDAACTPDFYLFDQDRKLIYRGQMDAARPNNGLPVNGHDLKAAVAAALAGRPVSEKQIPSVGCNIKWKPGNEPE